MTRFVRNVWAIFSREMLSYFCSPTAFVVLFLFLLTNGITFFVYIYAFRQATRQIDLVIQYLFGFAPFWILLLLMPPILTMRLFAEEKRMGTLESLMTTPLTDTQAVLGKFFAAQTFFLMIWGSLLIFVGMLEYLGEPDWGPVLAFYVGLFFLGGLFNAVGILASSATRNQLIAAVVALSVNLFLFFLQQCRGLLPGDADAQRFFDYISFHHHFYNEYSRGILDLRYPALYLLITVVVLFYAIRMLEARRWR